MWLLPTRNRPESVVQLINAVKETGDIPEVAVMVDGPSYNIKWPDNWHIHQSDSHLEMQIALNNLLEIYPNEPFYGVLADHVRPKSPEWSIKLSDIAGNQSVSLPNCGKTLIHPITKVRRLTSPCFGGDLIRAIGWIWLPSVVHMYGDDALEDIAYGLNIVNYDPEILVYDLALRDKEVKFDENHKRIWRGEPYVEHDRQAYIAWKRKMFPVLMEKLRGKFNK